MTLDRYGIDPDDPNASDRGGLAEYLEGRGVPIEDIRATRDLDEISRLVWSYIFGVAGERMTLARAAQEVNVTDEQMRRLVRAFGFGEDEGGVVELDLETLKFFGFMVHLLGEEQVLQLARVLGSSMARIAEALAATTRVTIETPFRRERGYAEFVRTTAEFVEGGMKGVARAMDRVLRYHMLGVSSRGWDTDPEGSAMTMQLAVGFADMVGFTSRSGALSTRDLATVIDRFEGRVSDVISSAGGRAVKFIGDEVLFTFVDPEAACRCALDLVALSSDADVPDVRVGLAYGEVVARGGDYYGAVVNLAARLEDIAPPGAVLVTPAVAERAPSHRFEKETPKELKGIEGPVQHMRLITSSEGST